MTQTFTATAWEVLKRRYLIKDDEGNIIESPEDMFRRVACNLAQAERNYNQGLPPLDLESFIKEVIEKFDKVMVDLDLLPNSPTLMNAGRELQQLSGCFVVPVLDSIEGIFEAVKVTALIHQSGGGTGFSFSSIRPEGDKVKKTGGIASGPVSFMKSFDTATEVVKQGGTRRGANMGILSVYHPDILKFIVSKRDNISLQNFNISVSVDKAFMEAVKHEDLYPLVNPRTKEEQGRLNAKIVFDLICKCAWETGDPGLIFIDRINEANLNSHLGQIEATNPCGEQPLLPYESCNLASINLANHLISDDGIEIIHTGIPILRIAWDKIRETCKTAVHMMDNVIDMNRYPIQEITDMSKQTRRIGIGVMGLADMLVQLGVRYDSEEGYETTSEVMTFVQEQINIASHLLGEERGNYPAFADSKLIGYGMRNTSPTTIAPTGTISMIAGTSSGIEPLFAICYTKTVMDNTVLPEFNKYFIAAMEGKLFWTESFTLSKEDMEEITRTGSVQDIKDVSSKVKEVFRCSYDIEPQAHVQMQKVVQNSTANGVSKTINMPENSTVEEVQDCYMQAYTLGLNGITIYRNKSKPTQVLDSGIREVETRGYEEVSVAVPETRVGHPKIVRPDRVYGVTPKVKTGHGTLYPTINSDADGRIIEVIISLGKAGGCTGTFTESIGRLLSTALTAGVDPEVLARQLIGISCPHGMFNGNGNGQSNLSVPDAIGRVLLQELGIPVNQYSISGTNSGNLCPDCGQNLVHQEGCAKCLSCGFDECN